MLVASSLRIEDINRALEIQKDFRNEFELGILNKARLWIFHFPRNGDLSTDSSTTENTGKGGTGIGGVLLWRLFVGVVQQ